jgi:hypothetical protein
LPLYSFPFVTSGIVIVFMLTKGMKGNERVN